MAIDVVVVGAGTAGLPCAIELAQAGARVTVLEKDARIGGTLHGTGGQLSASRSRLQAAKGIVDSPADHLADIMRIGRGKADPVVARTAVELAPDTLAWLEGLGLRLPDDQPVLYYGHDPYRIPRTYWPPEMGVGILAVLEPVIAAHFEAGRIDLRLGHRLVELIVEEGRVAGVRADGPDGPVELRAHAVVLATGGYAASRALFDELHPGLDVILGGYPTATGDGLVVARRAGAAVRNEGCHLSSAGGIETGPEPGTGSIWEAFANTNASFRSPREIFVNARGERFVAEDEPSQDHQERALQAQGGRSWLVFDAAAIDVDESVVIGWSADLLRAQAEAGGGVVTRAGSVEELARQAGIDPAGLVRTVAGWNAICAAGHDPFGRTALDWPIRTPPFYAVRTGGIALISFAGLAVDGELRVLDATGSPIPGLYAAGEVLGAGATMGAGFCSGMGVTPAIGFGRLLGRRLANAAGCTYPR